MKKSTKVKKEAEFNMLDNAYLKMLIAIIIFAISLFLFARATNIVENVVLTYDIDSNIDYKVYLFENEYIPVEYMQEGKVYVSNLVSKVKADFDYKVKTSKKFDSEYEYDIYAQATVAHSSSGKELWTQRIDLEDNMQIKVEDLNKNEIKVDASVDLPYNLFNTRVKSFKNQHDIPVKAFVDLKLVIIDKKERKEVVSTGISMDLYEDVFEVTEVGTGKFISDVTEEEVPNKYLIFALLCIVIISGLYTLFMLYLIIENSLGKRSYYSKAIYTILKNYGDIVAEIVKPVDISNLNVIDVKNFDQMLDVEEELRIPIMFFETVKNKEGWFVLVHNDLAYRYVLKDKEIKNKK